MQDNAGQDGAVQEYVPNDDVVVRRARVRRRLRLAGAGVAAALALGVAAVTTTAATAAPVPPDAAGAAELQAAGVGGPAGIPNPGPGFRVKAVYKVTSGVQNYTCTAAGTWDPKSTPEAQLRRYLSRDRIHHFGGPRWESLQDGIRWGVPGLGVKDAATGRYLENLQTEPDVLVRNEFREVAGGRDQQLEAAIAALLRLTTQPAAATP